MKIGRRASFAALAGAPLAFGQGTQTPNILFILSDDHSSPVPRRVRRRLDVHAEPRSFAREGMLFDRAFTAAPQCVPSRTALMTGRSPVAARMGRFSSPLPPDILTAPEVLREQGYYTGVCGRYFHLDGVEQSHPRSRRRSMRSTGCARGSSAWIS